MHGFSAAWIFSGGSALSANTILKQQGSGGATIMPFMRYSSGLCTYWSSGKEGIIHLVNQRSRGDLALECIYMHIHPCTASRPSSGPYESPRCCLL